MDKKPLTDPKTEQIKTECTYRDGHERASKRKANTLIANLNRDSSTEDEDGNQYDFARVKKKRAQSNDKLNNVECAANQHAHTSHKKASNVIADNSVIDDNSDTEIDNERIKHCSKRKADEESERASPELNAYPRRITPPNPKARLSLARQRRGNTISKPPSKTRRTNESKVVEQAKNQKKDNRMTAEEICRKLEEEWSDEEEDVVEKDVEIRPLPISRKIRSRLRDKQLPFSKAKTVKETRATAKEEGNDEEQNGKKRLKSCEQRKEEELCRIENKNGSWEHQLLSDDEDVRPSEINQVNYLKVSLSISLSKFLTKYCL